MPLSLKIIVLDFAKASQKLFNITPTITRILEKVEGSSGVHEDFRAVDIRDEYKGSFTYQKWMTNFLINYINKKYPRLDAFKVLIHHSFSKGPYHFHFQVPIFSKTLLLNDELIFFD